MYIYISNMNGSGHIYDWKIFEKFLSKILYIHFQKCCEICSFLFKELMKEIGVFFPHLIMACSC